MLPFSDRRTENSIRFFVFSPIFETLHFLCVGSASRSISDTFYSCFPFFRSTQNPFLFDRSPGPETGAGTGCYSLPPAVGPHLIREITTALALRAFSMTLKGCFFFKKKKEELFGSTPHPVTVANEGLVRDSLLKMQ